MKSIWKSRTLLALAVAALAACGGDAADDADAPAPGAQAPASQPATDDDISSFSREHASYRLTMPAVRRWFDAQERIYQAMGENPDLVDDLDTADLDNVEELEAHFDEIPEVRNAVSQAGLDMREYAAILISLYYVRSMDTLIQGGADRAAILANQQVDPANLEFAEQNRAELDRLQRRLEVLEESMQ